MSQKNSSDNFEENNQLSQFNFEENNQLSQCNFEEDNQLFQCNKSTNTSFSDSNIQLTIPDNYCNSFQEISNKIILSEKLETDEARDFIRKKTLGTKQILRFRTPKLGNKVKMLLKKLKISKSWNINRLS
jgi:hypothetical protein